MGRLHQDCVKERKTVKKAISLIMILALTLCIVCASGETMINPMEERSVLLSPAVENKTEEGFSPTTGLELATLDVPDGFAGLAVTGRYTPMLVQIDNSEGGVGNRAPWHASYADVVYETPLYRTGTTRLSMLFSDLIPEYVGPVRSARVNHVWIREEWKAALCFWGGQKYEKTSITTAFQDLGYNLMDPASLAFDGTTGGKVWNNYCDHTEVLAKPHDAYFMTAALATQVIPADYTAPNHAYRFTSALPEVGDVAEVIYVNWGNKAYNSMLEYDEDENLYYRYMMEDPQKPVLYDEINPVPNKGDKIIHLNPVTFSNVIIQFMDIQYMSSDAPLPTVTGRGNAEYFMGGKHIAGVWNRDTLQDRTVFYDMDGNEIEMQPGHTLIVMMDYQTDGRSVSYE